jgi:hypothetical protein
MRDDTESTCCPADEWSRKKGKDLGRFQIEPQVSRRKTAIRGVPQTGRLSCASTKPACVRMGRAQRSIMRRSRRAHRKEDTLKRTPAAHVRDTKYREDEHPRNAGIEESEIDQVLADSFPASDAPPWTLGVTPAQKTSKGPVQLK